MPRRNLSSGLVWGFVIVTVLLVFSIGLLLKQNWKHTESQKSVEPYGDIIVDMSEDGPGRGNLQNVGWVPCDLHFWSELGVAKGDVANSGSQEEIGKKLKGMSLKDLVSSSCNAPNGDSLALVAKHPNGWGQTSNWYVVLSHFGIEQSRIDFQTTVSSANTDDVPQCNFDFAPLQGVVVETDKLPSKVKVNCTGTRLAKDNTFITDRQSFLIDLSTKKVTPIK